MSDEAEYDLSGQWSGLYNYPRRFPPNSFEATIRESAGLLVGETTETDQWPPHDVLTAMITGNRTGSEVAFTKVYDDLDHSGLVILYRGTIQVGGDEIEGEWDIPGVWSGTFLMVRGPRTKASVERRVTEKIEL